MEIGEVMRRWQAGASQRRIAAGTGLWRVTVRRYIEAAVGVGLDRDGPAPSEEQMTRLAALGIAGPRTVETPTEMVLACQIWEKDKGAASPMNLRMRPCSPSSSAWCTGAPCGPA